jgi:uncharacterized protein (TIRG00374 family)
MALGGVFIWLGVRHAEWGTIWAGVRGSEWGWLVPAILLLAIATAIRVSRWQFLFARDGRPPFGPVARALLIGQFFNVLLPLRAGEAARLLSLYRSARIPRAQVGATVVLERVYDVAALLVLLFATLPWLPEVAWVRAAAWLALALGVGLVVAAVLLARHGETVVRIVLVPLRLLPIAAERREWANVNLLRGLAGLRDLRLGIVAGVLTLVSWLVFAVSFWLVMRALDLDLPFAAGVLVLVATGLALIVPSPPAGLGVFEAAVVGALAAYGLSLTDALPYALVLHAVNTVPYLVAGGTLLPLEAGYGRGRP